MGLNDPDQELMARVARGDRQACGELVQRHGACSLRIAQRMLGSRADAEDVVQEVWLKVWREAARWRPQAKFTTWLYRVTVNACIDHQRKVLPISGVDIETLPQPQDTQAQEREDTAKRVEHAMQSLPERQRAAVVLGYYEGISNHDAAAMLEMSLGAYQQLLFRARQQLKQLLQDELKEYRHG